MPNIFPSEILYALFDGRYGAHADVDALKQGQAAGVLAYTTKALLDANLVPSANTPAIVTNDADPANNTYFIKVGGVGAGSWQKSDWIPRLYLPVSGYTSLTAAVTAIGATVATLVINAPTTCTANTTIPATLAAMAMNTGSIDQGAYSLTVNGPFSSADHQVFTGTGPVAGLQETRPEWHGAAGDGSTDDRAAIAAALAAAKKLLLRSKTYRISAGISHTGRVHIVGQGKESVILSDGGGQAITVTDGDGSIADNFGFNTTGNAYMVNRWDNKGEWLVTPVYGFNLTAGYQLTGNDPEWATLPENQKTYQTTGLKFISSDNVKVSRIYGRFVGIQLVDCNYSSVDGSDFQGGTNTYTGIAFMATSATKLLGNSATKNKIRYASTTGIVFEGQEGIIITGNTVLMSGETGIKSQQNTYANTDYVVTGNVVKGSYWDGFDLLTNFPVSGLANPYYIITGNRADNNRLSGFNVEGEGLLVASNHATRSGAFGIWASGVSASQLIGNHLRDNNKIVTGGYASLFISGNDNAIEGNIINNPTAAYQVNNCLRIVGNNNQYNHNRLATAFASPLFVQGINNQGVGNTGLKSASGDDLYRGGMLALDNLEESASTVGLDFLVRRTTRKPAGNITTVLTNATAGAEYANMEFRVLQNGTEIVPMSVGGDGFVRMFYPPVYADNAAAVAAGRTAGTVYRTGTGQLMIVY